MDDSTNYASEHELSYLSVDDIPRIRNGNAPIDHAQAREIMEELSIIYARSEAPEGFDLNNVTEESGCPYVSLLLSHILKINTAYGNPEFYLKNVSESVLKSMKMARIKDSFYFR